MKIAFPRSLVIIIAATCFVSLPVYVQAESPYQAFSLEDLLALPVYSATRSEKPLAETAASVHVIQREDIRRSGVSSLPELLRMVPGLQLSQITASEWSIGIRGFGTRFSSKLLVMIDGRSIYTPVFSGVYWNAQDLVMEDIERIEVIRGPGGASWGANAVNGVINIITRHSGDTRGHYMSANAGNYDKHLAYRYGGEFSDAGFYRVDFKLANRAAYDTLDGVPAHDAWERYALGFRSDWEAGDSQQYRLSMDYYKGEAEQLEGTTSLMPVFTRLQEETLNLKGANILFKWLDETPSGQTQNVQFYLDQYQRFTDNDLQKVETMDLEYSRRVPLGEKHSLLAGINYRYIKDHLTDQFTVSFDPAEFSQRLYAISLLDEWAISERLDLSTGVKFEHNDYTGWEIQPNVRLLWKASERHSAWLAFGNAARTPSRSYRHARINYLALPGEQAPVLFSIFGNPEFNSEHIMALEMGLRGKFSPRASYDLSVFVNYHEHLLSNARSVGFESTPLPPHLLIARVYKNEAMAESYGLEAGFKLKPTENWKLDMAISAIKIDARTSPGNEDPLQIGRYENGSPRLQSYIRSSYNMGTRSELDVHYYYTGRVSDKNIESYHRTDLRFAWFLTPQSSLSFAVQNVFDRSHPEFRATDIQASLVPRTWAMQWQLKW